MKMRYSLLIALLYLGAGGLVLWASDDYQDIIKTIKPQNPITELQKKINDGLIKLSYEKEHGYLKSVLKHLKISHSSQMLVFSKTSLQNDRISPQTPRAIYFNDDNFIGWVQFGNDIEISTQDDKGGTFFYTLSQKEKDKPQFVRQTDNCTSCHQSSRTFNVPGHLVRSVFPNKEGRPILRQGGYNVNHKTDIAKRWGGWYVTGDSGKQIHMGNKLAVENDNNRDVHFDISQNNNIHDLSTFFNTKYYLKPTSDIVALMVMEHQTHMQNHLTAAHFNTVNAIKRQRSLNKTLKRENDFISEKTKDYIKRRATLVVKELLYCNEITLTSAISSQSTFKKDFEKTGLQDRQGRHLKQLDLEERLFKYPLSYVIYSKAFDNLHSLLKKEVYQQLHDILTCKNEDDIYDHITRKIGRHLLEILRDTKKDIPAYYKTNKKESSP